MERLRIMLTPNEIIERILYTFLEMLHARGLLPKDSLAKHFEVLKREGSDDMIYKVMTTPKFKLSDEGKDKKTSNVYVLKIVPQELTAVSKDSGILEFLDKYDKTHKIIVVKNIGQKVVNQLLSKPNTEVFAEEKMMYNPLKHDLQPQFTLISTILDIDNQEAKEKFKKEYKVTDAQIQRMDHGDPVAQFLGLKIGQVLRVKRTSEQTGYSIIYRIICHSTISKS